MSGPGDALSELVDEAESIRRSINRLIDSQVNSDSQVNRVAQMQARVVPVPSETGLNNKILEAGGINKLQSRLALLDAELELRGLE